MEDKARTCRELLPVLQHTDYFLDLLDLEYWRKENGTEIVTATFVGGYKKHANVTCDNCRAMIVDIIRQIS